MDKKTLRRLPLLAAAVIMLSLLAGCVMRPAQAGSAPSRADVSPAAASPEPTPVPTHTVCYYRGDELLGSEEVSHGCLPAAVPVPEGVRFLGWRNGSGEPADPSRDPIGGDTNYYALTRPLLQEGASFLFPDERGFLRPEELFACAEAAQALRALLAEPSDMSDTLQRLDETPDEALGTEDYRTLLGDLFDPEQAQAVFTGLFPTLEEPLTRARAAAGIVSLTGALPGEGRYFPDLAPDHWAYGPVCAAAAPGTLDPEALKEQTLDDFLWFDGYLYRLDEDGYFLTDETRDGLYYGVSGRYTSGDAQLDKYVAETLTGLMESGKTRLEHLRAVYLHVKNDFRYLPRNYYASGEKGWEIKEALTMFETGKGNCYNYTGAFCFLARGLGYNAVTYSGTMGTQNQPHSWTEITMDDGVYICDPEIELNYWLLEIYTDNFMMRVENSLGWNYQSVGRN